MRHARAYKLVARCGVTFKAVLRRAMKGLTLSRVNLCPQLQTIKNKILISHQSIREKCEGVRVKGRGGYALILGISFAPPLPCWYLAQPTGGKEEHEKISEHLFGVEKW